MRNVNDRFVTIKKHIVDSDFACAYDSTMNLLYDFARRIEVGSLSQPEKTAEETLDAIHFHELKE